MTMLMHNQEPNSTLITVQKLRFGAAQDFWMFVAAVAYGRVSAYGICCSTNSMQTSGESDGRQRMA